MNFPDTLTQADLFDAFDYDPETGLIHWLDTSPRIVAGTLAGTVAKDGHLVIRRKGRTYQAHHIAWLFSRGTWPTSQVLFVDGDPTNLVPGNLYLQEDRYLTTENQRRRSNAWRKRQRKKEKLVSTVPGVSHSDVADKWVVRDPEDSRVILGQLDTKPQAEAFAALCARGKDLIARNPPPPETRHNRTTHAGGPATLTLYELHRRFLYDPETGEIFERYRATPTIRRFRRSAPLVKAAGRTYMAGMLAWFLAYGFWPARRQLACRDGDRQNLRLDNLYLKDSA